MNVRDVCYNKSYNNRPFNFKVTEQMYTKSINVQVYVLLVSIKISLNILIANNKILPRLKKQSIGLIIDYNSLHGNYTPIVTE